MKFKGEFSISPSDWKGVASILGAFDGIEVNDEPQPSSGVQFMQIVPSEVYTIRQREDGARSKSDGRNVKPGDTIIDDDGNEFVVAVVGFRRHG